MSNRKADDIEEHLREHGNDYHADYRGRETYPTVIRHSGNVIHVHHCLPGGGMHSHYDSFVIDNDGKITLTMRADYVQQPYRVESLESLL